MKKLILSYFIIVSLLSSNFAQAHSSGIIYINITNHTFDLINCYGEKFSPPAPIKWNPTSQLIGWGSAESTTGSILVPTADVFTGDINCRYNSNPMLNMATIHFTKNDKAVFQLKNLSSRYEFKFGQTETKDGVATFNLEIRD